MDYNVDADACPHAAVPHLSLSLSLKMVAVAAVAAVVAVLHATTPPHAQRMQPSSKMRGSAWHVQSKLHPSML